MEQKVVRQFLNIIDEETIKKIFDSYVISEKIKINGFNIKRTDRIPKPIYIQALIKNTKNYENLITYMRTKYPYVVQQSKYDNMTFDEIINISNPIEKPYLIAAYLLEEERSAEKAQVIQYLDKVSEESIKNKVAITENIEPEEMSEGKEGTIEPDYKNKLLELQKEIISLRSTTNQYKNKAEELAKENDENKNKLKQLRLRRKELLENVKDLKNTISDRDSEIEKLNNLLSSEKTEYENLHKTFDENKNKLDKLIKTSKEYIEKNKIGILYDKEINEELDKVYVVTNNNVNVLLNNLEVFEKVYILERTVSERNRRSFIKREKDINRNILEFVYDDCVIEKIIEGAKVNGV